MEKFDTISHPPFLRFERFELYATKKTKYVFEMYKVFTLFMRSLVEMFRHKNFAISLLSQMEGTSTIFAKLFKDLYSKKGCQSKDIPTHFEEFPNVHDSKKRPSHSVEPPL